jgi:hypothetical protein
MKSLPITDEQVRKIKAIHPDTWATWDFVAPDTDTYIDSDWPGCDYRVTSGPSVDSGINIYVTGRSSRPTGSGTWKTRARIEFVGDGAPSEFVGGIVYSTSSLFENGEPAEDLCEYLEN